MPYKLGLDIIRKLRGKISGYAIPTYVIDTPSGKVPLYHNHILGEDKEDNNFFDFILKLFCAQ